MASQPKQPRSSKTYTAQEVLALLDEDNDVDEFDSEPEGLSSSEESDLDRQLQNLTDDSR